MLPLWYVSVNDGASAFSVFAATRDLVTGAVVDKFHREANMGVADDEEPIDVVLPPLLIFSPEEWTAHCVRTTYPVRRAS